MGNNLNPLAGNGLLVCIVLYRSSYVLKMSAELSEGVSMNNISQY